MQNEGHLVELGANPDGVLHLHQSQEVNHFKIRQGEIPTRKGEMPPITINNRLSTQRAATLDANERHERHINQVIE